MGIRRSFSAIGVVGALVIATALGGCAGPRRAGGGDTTGSTPAQVTTNYATAAQAWSQRYEANPNDKEAVLGYSRALRANGQTAQAVAVLEQAMLKQGKDKEIASAYGKALAANGNFDRALTVVRQANSQTSPDWRLLSAEGAILDQTGRHADARSVYETGLRIAPEEPALLNNLALSHLLTNETTLAEQFLRRASVNPRADNQVYQNLALVLGMNGRVAEAEQILRQRFTPDVADANVAYLRQMAGRAPAAPDTTASIRPKPTAARPAAATQTVARTAPAASPVVPPKPAP